MKVALLGNMNNNHFALARYLRDRGVEAEVLIFDNEISHFQPAADTFDLSFMSYCRTLGWGNAVNWFRVKDSVIQRDLQDYQVIIGCGLAPAFCHRVGRRLDVFVPYGHDLRNMTRFQLASPWRIPALWAAVHQQRRGISDCRVFQMDYTNPLYETLWQKFRGTSERWMFGLPMIHTNTYSPQLLAQYVGRTQWGHEFAALRQRSDLILFSHAQHSWGGPASDANQKGTDRLLQGFALFRVRHPEVKTRLVTLEYGSDVVKSKVLIEQLGVRDSVHWFPKMFRKDLMAGIWNADVVCAEFENSWLSSGVIYEALAMAKPILGYRDDTLYRDHYPHLYPMLNAKSPESICARLEEYRADPAQHQARGEEGRLWYEKYVVATALDKYLGYFRTREAPTGAAQA